MTMLAEEPSIPPTPARDRDPFRPTRFRTGSRAPHIEVTNVTQRFGGYTALSDVNLSITRGEFISLIGHSGCGKSTLLNLMAGLTLPSEGTVLVDSEPVKAPSADRCVVFQHHALLPWLSVYDNIHIAVQASHRAEGEERNRQRVARVLQAVKMWDHRGKKPGMLSGGQRQRVSVARAFAVTPTVLFLDEPFGAVDALTKRSLHRELIELRSMASAIETVVMVTHDIDEAIFLSDRIVVMTDGPAAGIREIVDVSIDRPRVLEDVLHSPRYVELRDHLLSLLSHDAVEE